MYHVTYSTELLRRRLLENVHERPYGGLSSDPRGVAAIKSAEKSRTVVNCHAGDITSMSIQSLGEGERGGLRYLESYIMPW